MRKILTNTKISIELIIQKELNNLEYKVETKYLKKIGFVFKSM